jgi:hypothetical protein
MLSRVCQKVKYWIISTDSYYYKILNYTITMFDHDYYRCATAKFLITQYQGDVLVASLNFVVVMEHCNSLQAYMVHQ